MDSEYFTLNTPKSIRTQHNGVETLVIAPSDTALFEPHEEHSVITGDRDIRVFEIKHTK